MLATTPRAESPNTYCMPEGQSVKVLVDAIRSITREGGRRRVDAWREVCVRHGLSTLQSGIVFEELINT